LLSKDERSDNQRPTRQAREKPEAAHGLHDTFAERFVPAPAADSYVHSAEGDK
jgi:hypothetical protein